jgi:hypothetical protein
LRLRGGEVGGMMKAEFAPVRDAVGLVPSRGSRGTDEHKLQRSDHGVAVECEAGWGSCGQCVPPLGQGNLSDKNISTRMTAIRITRPG